MDFYLGVKSDFDSLQKELKEIGEIYKVNRKKFEELKKQTPEKRVKDDNETLYYQIREMFNDLSEKKYSEALVFFHKQNRLLGNDSIQC